MKDFILTLLLLLSYAAAYADEVTFSITEGDRVEINAQIDGMKQYIKEGYDYEAAGDTEFGATVVSFLKRAETYLERKILVDKAEVFYREASPVGSSGLSTLDELVKGDLGYSGTDVDKEIEGIARVFKYEVYSVLMSKNGFEASPYAGWKKNFVDVIDDGKVIETSEIPNEIEKLSSQLIEIRDKALKDAENSIKKVKELISLKSANYVEQSEIEMKPLKSYSSPYRKEEVMRYAMAVNMEFKYRVIAAELKEKIASLEWIKLNPGTSKSEIANTKHKLKAYKKYVFRYKMQTPINILYRTGKEVESSIYMMVALGIQDIAFYKFPNVFLTEENAAFYEQFTNATFTQYMKDRFGSWAPYKSFGAFVATSHLIRALPAPSFILKISKWADSKLWGVGGTRIRGLALFSISMAAASKVSEAVSLYDNFNGELNFDSSGLDFISDDPDLSNVQSELSALANSYISKSLYYSFSDFMVSTGNFLTSFALSEMILKQINGRLIPWGYYGVKSKLNKTRCRALLNTITTALKNTPKAIKYTGNVFKTIFMDAAPMFLLASFIDKWMEVGAILSIMDQNKKRWQIYI